jgi:hypothetical protein
MNDEPVEIDPKKMKFFMDQLQNNKYLIKYSGDYNKKIDNIL